MLCRTLLKNPWRWQLQPGIHQCISTVSHESVLANVQAKTSCTLSEPPSKGKIFHSRSSKLGIESKPDVGNATNGLKFLGTRDLFTLNSVLSMYLRDEQPENIVHFFTRMQGCGLYPNLFTCTILLSACGRLEAINSGKQIHCCVVKMGYGISSLCEGSLIDMYAKCCLLSDARKVFDGSLCSSYISSTSLIVGYVKSGLYEEAINVFEHIPKLGNGPDEVAFIPAIDACFKLGRIDVACHWFSQIYNPNVVAWNVMISGHTRNGYHSDAFDYFLNMKRAGVRSTRRTLGSVLSTITALDDVDNGLLVHNEAIKEGLSLNVYVGSSLINMYSKFENITNAAKVFDLLDDRNVILWNAMIGGFAQNGYANEVFELFHSMNNCGFRADEFTYTSILSACGCLLDFKMGCQLHSFVIKSHYESNIFVINAVLVMYAKCGALMEVNKLFNAIKDPDVVTWNTIIAGYIQQEDEVNAFSLFHRMMLNGFALNEVSSTTVISGCADFQDLQLGKQIHCLSLKFGLASGLYVRSSLVDMYSKCGFLSDAREILFEMHDKNVVSMNSLIGGYAPHNLQEAIKLLHYMQVEELNPSEITFSGLLDSCVDPYDLSLGRQLHCIVLKRDLLYKTDLLDVSLLGMYFNCLRKEDAYRLFSESSARSTILWTAMISGSSKFDNNAEALGFYHGMRSYDVIPDQAAFVSVLKACAALASLRDAIQIHCFVFCFGYESDELTGNALVDMYAKCGDMSSSVQVFDKMSCKRNVISWNSLIVGFAKHGDADNALNILNKMYDTSVMPDEVTFLGILTACSHAGYVFEGRRIFDIMVNRCKIVPRMDHYACMVDLLGRWGFLKEAEELIKGLSFEPGAMIWATLLGAATIHGDEVRGRWAAEKLMELRPQDSSSYVQLASIYATLGNWYGVDTLRKEMTGRSVMKVPGWSSISSLDAKDLSGSKNPGLPVMIEAF